MKNIAVVFAGGIGRRMNSKALPKQFLRLYGKEIIIYTLEHFEHHKEIDQIVISCIEDWIPFMEELLIKYRMKKVKKVVPGGSTGQESIYHGLKAAHETAGDKKAVVLIHDGVRPLINRKLISECIATVREKGSAVTVAPAIETIIRSEGKETVDEIIRRSDSASMMSYYGKKIYLVEGPTENIKITTPMDYYTFKALVEAREDSQLFGV